jgi:hypothetical protein
MPYSWPLSRTGPAVTLPRVMLKVTVRKLS